MTKSASGVTMVTTGGVTLFVETGSGVGDATFAMFVNEPPTGAVTVSVRLLIAPFARSPRFHTTVAMAGWKPAPLALTKLAPDGTLSVTVTLLAADGPRFVTEIV